ncbi:unnamed protein product [Urochloa humidicola]
MLRNEAMKLRNGRSYVGWDIQCRNELLHNAGIFTAGMEAAQRVFHEIAMVMWCGYQDETVMLKFLFTW